MAKMLIMVEFEEGSYKLSNKPVKFHRLLKQQGVLDIQALKSVKSWSDGVILNLSWDNIKALVKEEGNGNEKSWNLVYSPVMSELWLTYDNVAQYYCKLSGNKVNLVSKEEEY